MERDCSGSQEVWLSFTDAVSDSIAHTPVVGDRVCQISANRLRLVLSATVALSTTVLLWPVWVNAFEAWSGNAGLTFGFLLLPTAGWLIWWKRATLRPERVGENPAALLVVLTALGMYLLCERVSARSPAAGAAGLLLWGECWYLWGRRTAIQLGFPISLVTFGLALEPTLIAPIAFWLQGLTATAAGLTTQGLGLPVVREGLLLRSDTFAFVVAEACSGMNSLLALLSLAGVWIYVTRGRTSGRTAVVASVLPLVLAANIIRVDLVLVVASQYGQDAAIGFFHGASSLVLFGLALVGLLGISRLAGCQTFVIR